MHHVKAVVVAAFGLAAFSSAAQAPPSGAPVSRQPAPIDIVAVVGSAPITLAEVDEKAMQQPASNFGAAKLSQALYDARRWALNEIIATRLLDAEATAQKVERSALVEKEITGKIHPVTDADVTFWYQNNQSRVQGATLEQVQGAIRQYLTQERTQQVREEYLGTLRAKATIRIMLDPPRQAFAAADSPARGPANAPVEIVEFSDFQCPYCQRANPTVQQVLTTYGDRVHFVYRHYPLPNHPNARPAAEAAVCAADQGKFWPYHDVLFPNAGRLATTDLKHHAAELGLDSAKFDACVDGHQSKARVDADVRAGEEAGVNGTPAFFVNGRMLSGAQPYDAFKRIIDEELELKKSR